MRCLYLITSHTQPTQVLRLVSVLRSGSPEAVIVVHHDVHRSAVDARALAGYRSELLTPERPAVWGHATHLDALLRALRHALRRHSFDWLCLLSGQDYPVRPIPEIEGSLDAEGVEAWMFAQPLEEAGPAIAARYLYRWVRLPRRVPDSVAQALRRALPAHGVRLIGDATWLALPRRRGIPGEGVRAYTGSDWFSLSRTAVERLLEFVEERPEFVRFYRSTLLPTESLFQTVLANDPSLRIGATNRRYVEFEREHPRILTLCDLSTVLASGADFARKFDITIDEAVLNEIDRALHAR